MKKLRWEWIALGLIVVVAFLLRVLPSLDTVFVAGEVWFRGVDSWYHMRLVDNMACNFPVPLRVDVYGTYPGGTTVGVHPLLAWLVVGSSYLVELGRPTAHTLEMVGAYLPPVVGSLTFVPVYFLAREVFNSKTAGFLGCLFLLILPTEFFHRSLLGFTDHHVLESFFIITTILLMVLAQKYHKWKFSALAGVSLGFYLLNWWGGIILMVLIIIWLIVEFLIRYFKDLPTQKVCGYAFLTLLIGSLMLSPFIFSKTDIQTYEIGLPLLISIPLILIGLSKLSKKVVLYIIGGVVAFLAFWILIIGVPELARRNFMFLFWGFGSTIGEGSPSTLQVILNSYGIAFFLFFGGLFFAIKYKVSSLFIVSSILMVVLMVGQRRWGYYAAIPISLLAAYLACTVSNIFKKDMQTPVTIVIALFVVFMSIRGTIGVCTLPNVINPGWNNAMVWLRENTPEPFGDPEVYYKQDIELEANYTVLSWWDYGHWIIRIGKRVTLTSPTFQILRNQATARFLSLPPVEAEEIIEGLNVRYVIIDRDLAEGKYYALIERWGPWISREDFEKMREESMVLALWRNKVVSYKKIYDELDVKIYERMKWHEK